MLSNGLTITNAGGGSGSGGGPTAFILRYSISSSYTA